MPMKTTRPDVPEAHSGVGVHGHDPEPVQSSTSLPAGPRPTMLGRAARRVARLARFVYRLLTEVP
jgi:hypothetical protein